MRVVQLLPSLAYGDGIGNYTLAVARLLREMGVETQIYAERIDPRLPEGTAQPFDALPALRGEDALIYHGSTYSRIGEELPHLGGRKLMIYHNITPPAFFQPYSRPAWLKSVRGLEQMRALSGVFERCVAVSALNREELLGMGYACPVDVCPTLIAFDDYKRPPDKRILREYGGDGTVNLLFVGRVAPNKRQEDVIRAFYVYHRYFEPRSRLTLIGAENLEKYSARLRGYVRALGLDGAVTFAGQVRFDELLAYYRTAHAFVCMSEHEGFCVPLVEAMFFDVPVVARRSTAVTETLADGGVLLEDGDPLAAAQAIDAVVRDGPRREEVLGRQRARLADFAYEKVAAALREALGSFLGAGGTEGESRR